MRGLLPGGDFGDGVLCETLWTLPLPLPSRSRLIGSHIIDPGARFGSDCFGRFWKDKDYALEGLEEMAQKIDPTHWKRRSVLPFWTVRVFPVRISGVAEFYPRTDRSSLLRSRNGAGMRLFRRTSPVAPNEAGFQGGHDSHVVFDEALTGEEFLQNP